jgi:ribosomal protein S12 methylthiotransferase accessory factor
MTMEIYFPGNKRVYADFDGYTVATDQPVEAGGDGTAPAPFDLFVASIGTCAGIYALGFMQQRGIDPSGARLTLDREVDAETRMVGRITIDLKLPQGFPERYREAIVRAMELCAVKKHIQDPPVFAVTTSV